MLLGDHHCGTTQKGSKVVSSRSRVRTSWFRGFFTTFWRPLPLGASQGWAYLQPTSALLLLVENRLSVTYFPPLSAFSREQWMLPGARRPGQWSQRWLQIEKTTHASHLASCLEPHLKPLLCICCTLYLPPCCLSSWLLPPV